VIDPLFWLGLSFLLVAVSLTAVLVALIPAVQEIARAARSIDKLADTLSRELPPTLEAIRLTGMEISELTDDVSQGVQSASGVVKQVDQSIGSAKQQAKKVQTTTRGVVAGVKAAWKTFSRNTSSPATRRSADRLPQSQRPTVEFREQPTAPVTYRPNEHNREVYRSRSDDDSSYSSNAQASPPLDSEAYWLSDDTD
jgi:ABC-type transporter Mla subunit MlaD